MPETNTKLKALTNPPGGVSMPEHAKWLIPRAADELQALLAEHNDHGHAKAIFHPELVRLRQRLNDFFAREDEESSTGRRVINGANDGS